MGNDHTLVEHIPSPTTHCHPDRGPVALGVEVAGRSAVWLARLLWEQEVPSSNLGAPTFFRDMFLALPLEHTWRQGVSSWLDPSSYCSTCLSGATPGDREGLGFQRVSGDAVHAW